MCGIIGSTSKDRFFELYKLNKERGDFSVGVLAISKDKTSLIKKEGKLDLTDIPDNFKLYLGHTRAPTGDSRGFSFHNSHPFVYGKWCVGHNGIIKNFNQLKFNYNRQDFEVDSNIIPYLMCNWVRPVESLELLDGIFGIWAYNFLTEELFLARNSSTIYVKDSDFSSAIFNGAKLLEEGKLYKFVDSQYVPVQEFKFNSPYFVL